jgi:hypothetical protein
MIYERNSLGTLLKHKNDNNSSEKVGSWQKNSICFYFLERFTTSKACKFNKALLIFLFRFSCLIPWDLPKILEQNKILNSEFINIYNNSFYRF